MLDIILERFRQKKRTIAFPKKEPELPLRFRGLHNIKQNSCPIECKICLNSCPTNAIRKNESNIEIDLGRCLFCLDCKISCPNKYIEFSNNYSLAANSRSDLLFKSNKIKTATSLRKEIINIFGRSLKLRQVSAGGCNACESDTNVLNVITFDLGRFGIQFVASPRHADGLLITGPITKNMEFALLKTYRAISSPKIVISVGACAISGGIFSDSKNSIQCGVDKFIPVDLYIPGCPPHPITILDGILRALNKK